MAFSLITSNNRKNNLVLNNHFIKLLELIQKNPLSGQRFVRIFFTLLLWNQLIFLVVKKLLALVRPTNL